MHTGSMQQILLQKYTSIFGQGVFSLCTEMHEHTVPENKCMSLCGFQKQL